MSFYYPSVFRFQQKTESGSKRRSVKFMELAPGISLLDVTRSSNGLFLENNIFFFLWYKRNVEENKTHLVVFPVYWYFANKKDTTQFVLPFYYKKTGVNTKKVNIAFIYHSNQTIGKRTNSVFPFWWSSAKYYGNDTVRKNTLFPVYWSAKSKDRNSTVLFPLFYSFQNQNMRSQTFFPLFSYGLMKDSGKSYVAITPLVWHIRSKNEVRNVLFPFFWNQKIFSEHDTINKIFILPLLQSVRSRNQNSDIFFPFVYSFKYPYKRSLTIFPLFSAGRRTDSSESYLAVTPFFWNFRTKESATTILFPVFGNQKLFFKDDTVSKTVLFPLLWSVHSRKKYNDVFFPLVYSFKDEHRRSFVVFPLFASGRMADSSRSYFGITPFFWHTRTKEGTTDLLFPLLWKQKEYRKDDTISKTVLFPLLWLKKSYYRSHTVLFPFVFSYKTLISRSVTVFPFFSYGKKAKLNQSHFGITPFFWHFQNQKGKSNLFIPVFLNFSRYKEHDTLNRNILFPVLWTLRSNEKNNTVLFPVLFSYKNKYKHSLTVFPLFSYGKRYDSGNSHIGVTPFFWHMESKYSVLNILFPFIWNRKEYLYNDTTNRTVVFPFFWYSKTKDRTSEVLFPFWFSSRDQYKKALTLFPVFSYGKMADSSHAHLAITPFFWHVRTKQDEINFLFPFFWNKKEFLKGDTVNRIVLFPILWSTRSKEKNSDVLFPFVFSYKDPYKRSLTLFPLFSYSKSFYAHETYLTVTPFFWHGKTPASEYNFLFPILWNRKEFLANDTINKVVIFPLLWSTRSKNRNSDVLFPFVFSYKDQHLRSLTIFPLYSFGQSSDLTKRYLALTPLFWHTETKQDSRNILFPLYFNHKFYHVNDTVSTTYIFPLFFSMKSRKAANALLFPIVYSFKDQNYHTFTFFPLMSAGHSVKQDKHYLMITPLFGNFHSPERTNIFLFPLFNYRKVKEEKSISALLFLYRETSKPGYSRTSFLWPLCEHLKYENHNSFRFAPFVWALRTDTSKMFSIQPLFYSYKSRTSSSFILSWFLYKHETVKGISVSNSLLWRVFYSKRYSNGDFESRFLYLVYANIKEKGRREKSLLPFYHSIKESNGNQYASYFFSFYNHFRQYKTEIKDFYEEERIFWFVRLRSNYRQLKSEGKGDFNKRG